MTVHSIGTDLAQIGRIESAIARRGERFLERVFTPGERAYADARAKTRAVHYAGRFAVKEAVMKVLGTGWTSGV
ncbi:MAG: holo-ACP synthase, partial [Planctomycetota bacterium]